MKRSKRLRRRRPAPFDIRTFLGQFPHLIRLLYRLLGDSRVPAGDKVIFGFALAYLLTPADLLPDFLGVLGVLDDLYLVGLALSRLLARAGDDLLLEHWDGDPHFLGYLIEGVDQLGEMLPRPIRRLLRSAAED